MKKHLLNFSLLCILCLLWIGGCKKEEGKILVKVGKTTLTEDEFYNFIPPMYMGTLTFEQKKELLNRWIDTELLYQKALEEKLHKDSQIKTKLQQMEHDLLANEFLQRYITRSGGVDEFEIKRYFDEHKKEYNTERRIAQIVVTSESQAYEIFKELKQGALFSKLASKYSIDPSSKYGGVMGYIRRGDMPNLPGFEDAVYLLKKVNDISEPIRTVYGYHIIKLLGWRKAAKKIEYNDVKESIANFLTLNKQRQSVTSLLSELREEKKVVENYNLLQ
ncbi:peptidylprolyl isomerase [candidate division WOR-3 bacterium]|nr:peptidylprolyl isomerase [candidate division WOR-3 bacterium]